MGYGLDSATAVNFHFAKAGGIRVGNAYIAGRGLGLDALHLRIILSAGIGFPVACIVGNIQHALHALVQPMQTHFLDVGHCTQVHVCPVALCGLPCAGEALCREDAAHGLPLALECNLLDGPVEGIILAEGQFDGVEGTLALEFKCFLQFTGHGRSLLCLLVGVVYNLSSARTSWQGIALHGDGI